MILLFPDLDTLRVALTSGMVPAEVALTPATASFDTHGKIFIETAAELSRTNLKNLDRLGVKGSKRHAHERLLEVSCWLQLLPLRRETAAPHITQQAPILFELEYSDDFPVLVSEMLRLGNDRQSFRWFATPERSRGQGVLLRVIGPPYYTLLRAIDRTASNTRGRVYAYSEQAPRIWVELGYTLPLADQLRAPDEQILLIRAPHEWRYFDDGPFQDVYEVLKFQLPAAAVTWSEVAHPQTITVPVKLVPSTTTDAPELWVVRENAIDQLDTLVRDADERLLQRLMFAIATDSHGTTTAVVRVRPSKLPPPSLALERAVAFKPYWKLPNLFLPLGTRLHPTLRRDSVRKLLADDPDQIVWLYPTDGGHFSPQSIPDAAFRSLSDWVEYVIDRDQQPLTAWIQATQFDFEHFVCPDQDSPKPKPKPDKGGKDSPRGEVGSKASRSAAAAGKTSAKTVSQGGKESHSADFLPPPEPLRRPNEWKQKAKELEEAFLALSGPLDSPERQALWPQLAEAYSRAQEPRDAAIAWLNALWTMDTLPPEWLGAWVRGELPQAGETIRAEDFDKLLHRPIRGLHENRAVIAAFLWLASQRSIPPWLKSRLPTLQQFLESQLMYLPIRAVWLAGFRLAQLSGSDVLGLARIRDRLLEELLTQGLTAERDLPNFLRESGLRDSGRSRMIRDEAMKLHAVIRQWLHNSATAQRNDVLASNQPFVDLFFAFALARLGEPTQARKLVADAQAAMVIPIPTSDNPYDPAIITAIVRNFLFRAFQFRIDQALAEKPHAGPLDQQILNDLEQMSRKNGRGPVNNPYDLAKYSIDRMRKESWILEPHEKPDPYANWIKWSDPLTKELAELADIRQPHHLAERIGKLYADGVHGKPIEEVRFHVLCEGLPLAARINEEFTVQLLERVPAALAVGFGPKVVSTELLDKQGELLRRALLYAGHFNRVEIVKQLVDEFVSLIHAKPEDLRFKLINIVASQCLRSLKKIGLINEFDRFLTQLQNEVLRGASLDTLRQRYSGKPEQWGPALQTLLNLAGGWLHFGLREPALPILEEARQQLLDQRAAVFPPQLYTAVARAYVSAIGQASPDMGLPWLMDLFQRMDPRKIPNTFTTAQHYSRLHLALVEDVIQVLIGEESASGLSARKWLEEDEYLVRRRIHADMRRALEAHQL
ncbi:MAG: hypothetical protein NZS48_16655 [Gemmata sp.]|nr:hypothetical protein [Gemmata sp.]